MSEPIKVGDLVMVVGGCPHCGFADGLGHVFSVAWVGITDYPSGCCGNTGAEACASKRSDGDNAYQVSILKRIDPPADAISEDARKPMEEPA